MGAIVPTLTTYCYVVRGLSLDDYYTTGNLDQCTGDEALGGKVSMCFLIWCGQPHLESLDQMTSISLSTSP